MTFSGHVGIYNKYKFVIDYASINNTYWLSGLTTVSVLNSEPVSNIEENSTIKKTFVLTSLLCVRNLRFVCCLSPSIFIHVRIEGFDKTYCIPKLLDINQLYNRIRFNVSYKS